MKRLLTGLILMALSSQAVEAQTDLHCHMIPDSYLEAVKAHLQTAHFKKYKEGTASMVQSLKLIDTNPLITATLHKSAIR